MLRVSANSAALAAAYAGSPSFSLGLPIQPATEEMLTMLPRLRATMPGSTRRARKKFADSETSMVRSQSRIS